MLCVTGLLLAAAAGGCQKKETATADSIALTPPVELGATIGSLAEVVKPEPVAVEGYGLVGGLAGTGSGYCPPEVRAYLKQYIATQLPNERVNVDELIESKNTAVVVLEAMVPATPSMGEHFDVRVALPPGSEATSIQGGWLYKAELVAKGTFGVQTRSLATVEGPVFINPIGTADLDLRSGHILGGGRTLYEYTVRLRLSKANYRAVSLIRNRLSERYGPNIANAVSPSVIEVTIPVQYRQRKTQFRLDAPGHVPGGYERANQCQNQHLRPAVGRLRRQGRQRDRPGGGRPGEYGLNSVRFSIPPMPRCVCGRLDVSWRLGDNRGLAPLRDLALDPKSPYRLEALDAVMILARRADAITLAHRLLRDDDVAVVLAAYDKLRQIDDRAVSREVIGRGFLLEQVVQSSHKAIFVSRSGDPRVVLFGDPLKCHDNLFVESPDQTLVLDARAGQGFVSVIRKHPTRPGVIGPIRSKPDVGEIVRTLGDEPATGSAGPLQSLGIPYSQVIALLEQMSAKDAVAAQFWAGPLPKIGPSVKN